MLNRSVPFACLNDLSCRALYLLTFWSLLWQEPLSHTKWYSSYSSYVQCVLVWRITNIADYTAPRLSLKTDPASCRGKRESPLQRAVTLPTAFLIPELPPSPPPAFDEKTCQQYFKGLLETDSMGFMFFWNFCLNCEKLKSQVWTCRHRHQPPTPPPPYTSGCRVTTNSN